jgi:regulator of sigma E protease
MLHFLQNTVVYVLPFMFVLGLVVTIHELGHFLAAKWCGVAIDRFAIGFGRPLVSWKDKAGVQWQVGWIPLGGYVRFSGDESAASVPDHEDLKVLRSKVLAEEGPAALRRYFHFKPVWQRAIVVAAGPVANFVLSTVIFGALLATVGETITPARIDGLVPGGVAARAGFRVGDVIKSTDGKPIDGFDALQGYVAYRSNTPIHFTVQRAGGLADVVATPAQQERPNPLGGTVKVGVLGIQGVRRPGDVTFKRYGPIEAIGGGAKETWDTLTTTVFVLGRLVHGQVPADQLNGPLGIAQASGAVAKMGAQDAPNAWMAALGVTISLLKLAGLLSVSIGFMNLLPVPVLDGGHLLFYAYEAAARRPVGVHIQAAGYRVGLALLLGLMLFATWNDLQRLRVFQFLGGLFS